jgi:ATP-dependent DNA ligase
MGRVSGSPYTVAEEEKTKAKAEKLAKIKEQAEKDQKLSELTKEITALSERAARSEVLEKENIELKEKIALQALTEDVEKTMTFSETVKVGFPVAKAGEVAKFMTALSEVQRAEFKKIVGMIQHVDLSESGAVENPQPKNNPVQASDDAKEEEVTKLTEKKMKENVSLSMAQAQREAYKEIYGDKK